MLLASCWYLMITCEELLHYVYLNLRTLVSFMDLCVYLLCDPLRGGDLLEENGCITSVPEWREGGHVRGGPSPYSLGGETEKIHVREHLKNKSV